MSLRNMFFGKYEDDEHEDEYEDDGEDNEHKDEEEDIEKEKHGQELLLSGADGLFKGNNVRDIIDEILEYQYWKGPLTNRHFFIDKDGNNIERITFKDGNLIITGGRIYNIFEISLPSTLQAKKALKEESYISDETDLDKLTQTNKLIVDLSEIPIYLYKCKDKDIEYGNIQTDIAYITLFNGQINDIILYGKFFDNDGDDSIGNNTPEGRKKVGKFGENLICRIVKTEEGFEGKIEMWELDDPIFLKAAKEGGFSDDDMKKVTYSYIKLDNIRMLLGKKKYSNDNVVKFLDPSESNYEDDNVKKDDKKEIILHEIGGLSKDGNLIKNEKIKKEKRTIKNKVIKIISLIGLGYTIAYAVNEFKQSEYKDKTTPHPKPPKLIKKVTKEDLQKDKGDLLNNKIERITKQYTITIKKGEWFGKAVKDFIKENGLEEIQNLQTFINEDKKTGEIGLSQVNPGDTFEIYLEGDIQGNWNIIWADKN